MKWVNQIHIGHVLDILRQMPDELVDCIITSPPYWGLRDYGLEPQIWDEQGCCEHEWGDIDGKKVVGGHCGGILSSGLGGNLEKRKNGTGSNRINNAKFCLHCSAWRGSLGLEPTPELYVQHIVQIFREARRVLKKEGTLWLNLGDSYVSHDFHTWDPKSKNVWVSGSRFSSASAGIQVKKGRIGLPSKNLVGIPWRVALALQTDGWWLRSDIIWSKPNPMPESVTDRPSKSHEYIFLLAKNQKYYFDQVAVMEKSIDPESYSGRRPRGVTKVLKSTISGHVNFEKLAGKKYEMRNIRSVWTVTTQGFKEAHFATYPEKLVEPMIKAGTSEKGCCPKCGKAWERVVEHKNMVIERSSRTHSMGQTRTSGKMVSPPETKTIGWQPACDCGLDPVPCVVLDPFMGSGTTAKVAIRLRRDWIGIDLKPEYVDMADKRKAWTQVEMI